jgi:hypothetical protein
MLLLQQRQGNIVPQRQRHNVTEDILDVINIKDKDRQDKDKVIIKDKDKDKDIIKDKDKDKDSYQKDKDSYQRQRQSHI